MNQFNPFNPNKLPREVSVITAYTSNNIRNIVLNPTETVERGIKYAAQMHFQNGKSVNCLVLNAHTNELEFLTSHPDRPEKRDERLKLPVFNRGEECWTNHDGGLEFKIHVIVNKDNTYKVLLSNGNTRRNSIKAGQVDPHKGITVKIVTHDSLEESKEAFNKDDNIASALTRAQKASHSIAQEVQVNTEYFQKQTTLIKDIGKLNSNLSAKAMDTFDPDNPAKGLEPILSIFDSIDLMELKNTKPLKGPNAFNKAKVLASPTILRVLCYSAIRNKDKKGYLEALTSTIKEVYSGEIKSKFSNDFTKVLDDLMLEHKVLKPFNGNIDRVMHDKLTATLDGLIDE